MKRKLAALLTAILLVLVSTGLTFAQSTAYTTSFTTSITYQNVGTGTADVSILFYPQGSGTPISIARPQLAKDAGTSLFIGSLTDLSAGFRGSAVLSSNQPVVATLVQIPASTSAVKNRPLSNGFSAESGAAKYLIATVLKAKFNSTTQFSVQNVDTEAVNLTVKYFNADANGALTYTDTSVTNLPAGSAKYFDAGLVTQLPAGFNGSVTIEAAKVSGGAGKVVASALELSTTGTGASSFEGVASGATTVYMPSAICNAFGGQNSAYAVQNTETAGTATVTVTYSNGHTESKAINAGAKQSFQGCGAGNAAGFSGSATITSTGGNIVAIGKISGTGLSTAFLGATSGAAKLALPYVRWSQTQYDTGVRQRAFIAIQNVGSALAANTVTVKYLDKDGVLVGTHTLGAIAAGGKVNSNPSNIGAAGAEFGYSGTQFGGSAIIEGPAGSQLVAVVRVTSKVPATGTTVGEDYNGISIQ